MDHKPGMAVHTCNPRAQEAEAGGFPQVPGQCGLHRDAIKTKTKKGWITSVAYFVLLQSLYRKHYIATGQMLVGETHLALNYFGNVFPRNCF